MIKILQEYKICEYCNSEFYRNDFLKNFNRMVSCGKERCKLKQRTERGLIRRLQKRGESLDDFKLCRYCNKKYYRKNHLIVFNIMDYTCGDTECKIKRDIDYRTKNILKIQKRKLVYHKVNYLQKLKKSGKSIDDSKHCEICNKKFYRKGYMRHFDRMNTCGNKMCIYKRLKKKLGIENKRLVSESLIKKKLDWILGKKGKKVVFKWLKSPRGNTLRLDHVYEDIKLAIECDGEQHNDFKHFFNQHRDGEFEYRKKCDNTKDIELKRRGWVLLRIPYNSRKIGSYKKLSEIFSISYLVAQLEKADLGHHIINKQEILIKDVEA